MWKVYKEFNSYIQGTLIGEHKTESAAMKKAKKEIEFTSTDKVEDKKETVIWLEDERKIPVGVIVKKDMGAKRPRQGKKKK